MIASYQSFDCAGLISWSRIWQVAKNGTCVRREVALLCHNTKNLWPAQRPLLESSWNAAQAAAADPVVREQRSS
eukprot:scaffold152605_cov19-Prasinocladus_malaysianus.AAC.1